MLNKYTIRPLALAIILAGLAGCEPEIEREYPAEASGQADFSVYVALGNSLTAGFSDGFLNRAGQINSYPAIIADKMAAVTPNFTFNQPLMPEGTINGTLQFHGLVNGLPDLKPKTNGIRVQDAGTPLRGSFQNLGIPDAKAADLTQAQMQTSTATYFFSRFQQQGQSPVQMATAQNPTFFTLWIGNNDVLEYATGGGENNPDTPHTERITPVEEYEASMKAIVSQLKQGNSTIKGAVANIPSVEKAPYFNVVPWNAFALDEAQATLINAGLKAQIEPRLKYAVDSVVKTMVIRGVITSADFQQNIRGGVANAVAPQAVYKSVYDRAIAGGADEATATAQAEAYVASSQGQNDISNLKNALMNNQAPQAVQSVFDTNVVAQTESLYTQSINNMSNLAPIISPQGAAAVDQTFNSSNIVAVREQNLAQTIAGFKAAAYYPVVQAGPNGFVVYSDDSPTGIKQLTATEKITLRFLTRKSEEFDPAQGRIIVPDKYALDAAEMQRVNNAITAYNEVIANLAAENNLALVDINAFFNEVVNQGVSAGGRNFTNAYILGNAFSLDGIHLTQAGYALAAQRFIEAINSKYNSKLPLPDISMYPGIALPPGQ